MAIYQSDDIKELATALAKAQAEMKPAPKDKDNPFYKSKYADLAGLVEISRPILTENNISVIHIPDYDDKGNQVLWVQLMHSSGQWIRGPYKLTPTKQDPQSVGSANTYSRRNSYGSITGMVTEGEDDDGNAASGKEDDQQVAAQRAQKVAPPVPPAPKQPAPLPHPGNAPISPGKKSVFATVEQRDSWYQSVTNAIATSQTIADLEKIKTTYKERMLSMKTNAQQGDVMLLGKLNAAFEMRWDILSPTPAPKQVNVDTVMMGKKPSVPLPKIELDDEIPF